jgi:hypothetical protein
VGGGLGMALNQGIVKPEWQFALLALVTCVPLTLTVIMLRNALRG